MKIEHCKKPGHTELGEMKIAAKSISEINLNWCIIL